VPIVCSTRLISVSRRAEDYLSNFVVFTWFLASLNNLPSELLTIDISTLYKQPFIYKKFLYFLYLEKVKNY